MLPLIALLTAGEAFTVAATSVIGTVASMAASDLYNKLTKNDDED